MALLSVWDQRLLPKASTLSPSTTGPQCGGAAQVRRAATGEEWLATAAHGVLQIARTDRQSGIMTETETGGREVRNLQRTFHPEMIPKAQAHGAWLGRCT